MKAVDTIALSLSAAKDVALAPARAQASVKEVIREVFKMSSSIEGMAGRAERRVG